MKDLNELADDYGVNRFLDKFKSQNFGPNDSVIASSLMHPIEAMNRAGNWLQEKENALVNAGIYSPYDPEYAEAVQSGLDLAGLMQTGAMPFAPASAGGTLGTFIGKRSKSWDPQAAKLAEEKLNAGADPAEVWREHLIGRMPDKTLFSEISDKDANLLTARDIEAKIAYQKILAKGMKAGIKDRNASLKIQPDLFAKDIKSYNKQQKIDADAMLNEITRNYGLENYLPAYEGGEPRYGTFSKNVYMHPELFENYPDLGKSVTRLGGSSDRFHGSFSPNSGAGHIEVFYPSLEAGTKNSTMAHEMAHAIQNIEGWGRGGNEAEIRRNPLGFVSNDTIEYAKSLPRYQEMANDADRQAFIESFAKMKLGHPYDAYRKLAGEAQARATQDRLDMSMAQRRENYPLAGGKLSDIPLADLIYKYEGEGPSLDVSGYGSAKKIADVLNKKYGQDINADISGNDKNITLNKLIVDPEKRNQGIGSSFLKDLTQYADEESLPIHLTAAGDFGGNKARQIALYKKHGFLENKGKNKDYAISENMYRTPVDVDLLHKYNELHPDKNYLSWDVTSDPHFTEEGDEIAGDPYALIEKVYVHPEDRNKGIATKLMRNAMEEIKNKHPNMPVKLTPIPLDKDTDIERLTDFYKKFGFDEMPEGHMEKYAYGGEVKALHDKYAESDYGFGYRPDNTQKGLGYFGILKRPDGGIMTEYSVGVPIHGKETDVPTLVPTLTPDEIRHILNMKDGEDVPRAIIHKAIDHAHKRLDEGKPIFATEEDLYAHGGIVDILHNDNINQIIKAFAESMDEDVDDNEPDISIEIKTAPQIVKKGKIPTTIVKEKNHG